MAGFIGRQAQMTALQAKLDDAQQRRGSAVMLSGEPGIGKTRLAREFAVGAEVRGAAVLMGGCYEGDWQPAYNPWREAVGGYLRNIGPDALAVQVDATALPVVRLVPELESKLGLEPPPLTLGASEERFRLYEATTQFFLALARSQPTVLVLDDLHWADRESLHLLGYLARFLSGARLLVIGTYRDTELNLDPGHPLAELLLALRRDIDFAEIPLRGLTNAEVAEYVADAVRDLAGRLADPIYAETRGNPFYVGELIRHLLDSGEEAVRSTEALGGFASDFRTLGVPQGVRQVLRARLARLSAEASQLLATASAF